MLKLYVGNRNYSSWSMRPAVLARQLGIPCEEVLVRFDSFDANSEFKKAVGAISQVGLVPVLTDGDFSVWDTLAIAEYLAEKFPEKNFWPKDSLQRARARSLSAEMHSGFGALRGACPMNIEAILPTIGSLAMRDNSEVRSNVARIESIFIEQLSAHGGPYLFGKDFCIADAFYAPICMRFHSYQLSTNAVVLNYIDSIRKAPGVASWIADALKEEDFLDFEEPFRVNR